MYFWHVPSGSESKNKFQLPHRVGLVYSVIIFGELVRGLLDSRQIRPQPRHIADPYPTKIECLCYDSAVVA